MNAKIIQVSLPIVAFIIGLIVYPSVPEQIPINWIQGNVLYLDKLYGLFIIPAFMVIMVTTLFIYHHKKGQQVNKLLDYGHHIGLLALLTMQLFIVAVSTGFNFEVNVLNGFVVGLICILLGNPMPKLKPNGLYGVRTPWTLKDERVWRKSNRLGGQLLVLSGIIIISMTFVLPEMIIAMVLTVILSAMMIAVTYSYVIYKKLV